MPEGSPKITLPIYNERRRLDAISIADRFVLTWLCCVQSKPIGSTLVIFNLTLTFSSTKNGSTLTANRFVGLWLEGGAFFCLAGGAFCRPSIHRLT